MTQLNYTVLNRPTKLSSDIAPRGERSAPARQTTVNEATAVKEHSDPGARGLIRPGQAVTVNEHGADAVLVKSPTRLRPGTRTDLHLIDQRRILRGEIDRCRITDLDPLSFEAVFIFHQSVEMPETQHA